MNFPANLKYSKQHEWIEINGGFATIGISVFAQSELGDIVYVDINTVGETLSKDEVFGSIEAVKTVSDLYMPIGGKVIEYNTQLDANPALVNTDPYTTGWIVKIEITNLAELDGLLDHNAYAALVQ